jgi:SAM-dependent methyltransferase
VDLALCDDRNLELPAKKFASAFWKEGLFRVTDKTGMLTRVYDALRPGGGMAITDFVKPGSAPATPSVEEWSLCEPVKPVLWSAEEMTEALTRCHFHVSVAEDISDKYRHMVIAAWKRWLVLLPQLREEGRLEAQFLDAMMAEVAYWVHRAQIIESGDLRVYRFLAFKSDSVLADDSAL